MGRRILTAREQHEMLSPWKTAKPAVHHWDLDWSQAEQTNIPTSGLRWRQYPDYGKPTGRFNFKKMPPVKVLMHEGEPWIMDGHHRVDWAQKRGYGEVPALVLGEQQGVSGA